MDTLTPQDRDHLRILVLMHALFAGLGLLGLGFIGVHYAMMRTFMRPEFTQQGAHPPPPEFLSMFIGFYVLFGTLILTGMVLNLLAARWLRARRHRTFCIVVAALDTLQVPFGTALGVFAILVLMRDSVRQAFDAPPAAPDASGAPDV